VSVDGQAALSSLGDDEGAALPMSAALIAAVRSRDVPASRGWTILEAASALAIQHRTQWRAEDETRSCAAPDDLIVANKQLIDSLNARRVELVERIDDWIARHVPQRAKGTLHTETLGSVVDRLAIAYVRCENLTAADSVGADARAAIRQLGELASAYDCLVSDVIAGRRRLPEWRSLKSYRSGP
jgi:uncharacterized protein DUF4254